MPTDSHVLRAENIDLKMRSGGREIQTVAAHPSHPFAGRHLIQPAELNGQIVRYDATRSRLTLRDPMSPQSLALRVTPSTVIVNHGQPASPQTLSAGMLVQVWFSPAQKAATKIEILAERGNSFTFQGRVVSVDLRTRSLAISNDTDQNVHEIAIGALDNSSLGLLREGADVTIQAEFDGDRYNARSVALVPKNQ